MRGVETICCLVDQAVINSEVFALIAGAKKSVYVSRPMIDLARDPVMLAINHLCASGGASSGPDVFVLMSSDGYNVARESGLPTLPPRCTVRVAKDFGPKLKDELIPWTRTVEAIVDVVKTKSPHLKIVDEGIYKYNQCYVLIDESILLIGPIGSLPLMVVSKCYNPNFVSYAKKNWDIAGAFGAFGIIGPYGHVGSDIESLAADGILLGPQIEETMCRWIDEAKSYCYIETSVFISHKDTKNRIAERLVKRLLRSYLGGVPPPIPPSTSYSTTSAGEVVVAASAASNYPGVASSVAYPIGISADAGGSGGSMPPPFRCLIVTNPQDTRSTAIESKEFVAEKINLTLEYIMTQIESQGVNPALLKDRIFVGVTEQHRIPKAGGTILMVDGQRGLFTSATICDRSLGGVLAYAAPAPHSAAVHSSGREEYKSAGGTTVPPGDSEIGVAVCVPERIESLEETIYWKRGNSTNFAELFSGCLNGRVSLVKHMFWKDDAESDSFKLNDFAFRKLLGASYLT